MALALWPLARRVSAPSQIQNIGFIFSVEPPCIESISTTEFFGVVNADLVYIDIIKDRRYYFNIIYLEHELATEFESFLNQFFKFFIWNRDEIFVQKWLEKFCDLLSDTRGQTLLLLNLNGLEGRWGMFYFDNIVRKRFKLNIFLVEHLDSLILFKILCLNHALDHSFFIYYNWAFYSYKFKMELIIQLTSGSITSISYLLKKNYKSN